MLSEVAGRDRRTRDSESRFLERQETVARHRDELGSERDYLREEERNSHNYDEIIGKSPALMQVLSRVEAVARTNANVLILGESGVGKELVARAIHERSTRRDQVLVKVNCPSIPRDLFESEFFGHLKGAFTGAYRDRIGRCELADKGSLFLDEVGEIPLDLQAKLLQVLQDRQFCRVGEDRTRNVDVRIIVATNRDLLEAVQQRHFREDLYYRLSVFPIEVPPLRERYGDIPLLIEHFLHKGAQELGLPVPRMCEVNTDAIQEYAWPGNVRELKNIVDRALILSQGKEIRLQPAQPGQGRVDPREIVEAAASNQRCLTEDEMRELQYANTLVALRQADWKISGEGGAAALLGINPSTLAGRMKSLNISRRQ